MLKVVKFILIASVAGVALARSSRVNNLLERFNTEQDDEAITKNCRGGCPRIFDPICAVDEEHPEEYKYFSNECLMKYDSCYNNRAWKPTQMSLCKNDIDPVLRAACNNICPFSYIPVCGTDGKNYKIFGNQCTFDWINCLANGKWVKVPKKQCGL